jgi:acetate CoA/acetoacetate CoA-transferase beta subunit
MDKKEMIAKRIAQILKPNEFVNLGIGIPTLVAKYIDPKSDIHFHSENGFTHAGPIITDPDKIDKELINASDQFVSILPGGAFFDSATSFGIVRGGHLDWTILGALQVDAEGNLANWKVPGAVTVGVGGGMDLVSGDLKVIIAMEHCSKDGTSKIVNKCDVPLTGLKCVNIIVTDLAVIEVTNKGLVLKETAPGVSIEQVLAATEADLILDPNIKTMDV